MRKLPFFLMALLCSNFSEAQITDFDLSTYKLPDIKRHQLNLNFDLAGSNYLNDYNYTASPDYYNKSNSIGGQLDIDYNFYRNTDKIQSNQNIGIFLAPSFSDRKDEDGLVSEYIIFTGNLNLNSENRFYFNGKNFIETDLGLNGNIIKTNDKDFPEQVEDYDRNIEISIPVYLGYGRIEQVQDIGLAIYILEDLNKQGKLVRVPSEDEIIAFAELISKLKNARFFDSRIKKIEDLETVDSFLNSLEIIDSQNIEYFTLLNDNWDFASNRIRESGNRISIGIEPKIYAYYLDLHFEDDFNVVDSDSELSQYRLLANIKFDHMKPINLFWQSSFSFKLSGGYLKGTSSYDEEIETPVIDTYANYRLGYYPNTRTDLSLFVGLRFFKYFGKEKISGIESDINYFKLMPNSNINLNYYISPRVRLNLLYSIYCSYSESDSGYYGSTDYGESKYFGQQLNLGLKYYIF